MKKLLSLLLAAMLLATAALACVPAAAEEASATAWLLYTPVTGWPPNDSMDGSVYVTTSNATVTGEVYYTVSLTYTMPFAPAEGAQRLHIVIDNGNALFPGMYMNVTDVRVDGASISCDPIGYGPTGYSNGIVDENDSYAVLYDQVFVNGGLAGAGHATWDGSDLQPSVIDPNSIVFGTQTIEVDFFLSSQQNVEPAKPGEVKQVWYNSNTTGVAGLSLKDLGIADDWHNIVPVDLTAEGVHAFPMVAADAHQIGTAYVIVANGQVQVHFEYVAGEVYEKSQCIKWFTSLEQLTAAELTSIEGGLTAEDSVSIAEDLGNAEVAYLSINNKVTFRSPVDRFGHTLPRYFRNAPVWVAYREQLMTLLPADAE